MHDAQRGVAVAHLGHQHAHRAHVVDLAELQPLALHLAPDRIDVFCPAADVGFDAGGGQLVAQLLHDVIDVALAVETPLVQQAGDLLVLLGFEVAERQVFQLPLDVADAKAMGQRCIDVEHLAGHPVAFLLGGILDRTDRTGALGQLDQRHAHVVDHRHQHLAQVFHLGLGAEHHRLARIEAGADRRHAQHAFDQLGDRRAEALLDLLQRCLALAHRTVQHRSQQRLLVELELGEDLGDFKAGAEAGHALGPDVLHGDGLLFGLAGQFAGLAQAVAFEGRINALNVIQPGVEIDAAVVVDRLLRSYLYHRVSYLCWSAPRLPPLFRDHPQAPLAPAFCGPVRVVGGVQAASSTALPRYGRSSSASNNAIASTCAVCGNMSRIPARVRR